MDNHKRPRVPTLDEVDALLHAPPQRLPVPKSRIAPPRQLPAPAVAGRASEGGGAAGAAQAATTRPGAILVDRAQERNPLVGRLRGVQWAVADDLDADFHLSPTTVALFLSLRFHQLHPDYIPQRLDKLKDLYTLRILLVHVDLEDSVQVVNEVQLLALMCSFTPILAWSLDECAMYLETYKSYERKPADAIREQPGEDHSERLAECLTTVKSVNKSDASSLASYFGSFRGIAGASAEELAAVPGLGPQKARHRSTRLADDAAERLNPPALRLRLLTQRFADPVVESSYCRHHVLSRTTRRELALYSAVQVFVAVLFAAVSLAESRGGNTCAARSFLIFDAAFLVVSVSAGLCSIALSQNLEASTLARMQQACLVVCSLIMQGGSLHSVLHCDVKKYVFAKEPPVCFHHTVVAWFSDVVFVFMGATPWPLSFILSAVSFSGHMAITNYLFTLSPEYMWWALFLLCGAFPFLYAAMNSWERRKDFALSLLLERERRQMFLEKTKTDALIRSIFPTRIAAELIAARTSPNPTQAAGMPIAHEHKSAASRFSNPAIEASYCRHQQLAHSSPRALALHCVVMASLLVLFGAVSLAESRGGQTCRSRAFLYFDAAAFAVLVGLGLVSAALAGSVDVRAIAGLQRAGVLLCGAAFTAGSVLSVAQCDTRTYDFRTDLPVCFHPTIAGWFNMTVFQFLGATPWPLSFVVSSVSFVGHIAVSVYLLTVTTQYMWWAFFLVSGWAFLFLFSAMTSWERRKDFALSLLLERERRQMFLEKTQTDALISSIFPKSVAAELIAARTSSASSQASPALLLAHEHKSAVSVHVVVDGLEEVADGEVRLRCLSRVLNTVDNLGAYYGAERIKTVGTSLHFALGVSQ
eukprot:m51a1_g14600 putative dna excision repair protein ercc-1 (871) ;mRNA; r:1178969-1185637